MSGPTGSPGVAGPRCDACHTPDVGIGLLGRYTTTITNKGEKTMNGPTYSPPITDVTDCWDQEEHDEVCSWGCDSEVDHDESVSAIRGEMAFDASRE